MWLCARVELGGFMACGVFAFLFLSLSLFFSLSLSLPIFWGFAFVALLVFGSACVVVVGFLSLSDGFRYEKGAHFLRPFLRCVVSWLLESVTGG